MKLRISITAVLGAAVLFVAGCKSSPSSTTPSTTNATKYEIHYLVADAAGYASAKIDAQLLGAWGMTVGPTGAFWIAANDAGASTVYDGTGATAYNTVTIPSRTTTSGGSPTGVVYNSTGDFNSNYYIYCSEDGILSAWNGGSAAQRVYTNLSLNAVYKGLAIASDGGNNYLYVANFKERKIDVFDKNFSPVSGKAFLDTTLPANFGPFNIAAFNGQLYVSYAKFDQIDSEDDAPAAGNGYIDIFNTDGSFAKRFASQGNLNSPWGMAMAPATFGTYKNDLLVGNFGDGKINAFDGSGNFLAALTDTTGKTIVINGLWGMLFTTLVGNDDPSALYFTAAPGPHGIFGSIHQPED